MGKRNSYLFCRMHDMKDAIWPDQKTGIPVLNMAVSELMKEFVEEHPNFSKRDAVLSICGMLSLDDSERRIQYKQQMDQYGNDLLSAVEDILDTNEEEGHYLVMDENDRKGLYIITFCLGIAGQQHRPMLETACLYLDKVLQMEERGVDVKDDVLIWVTLAYLLDFELWHDNKYGAPIIGSSQTSSNNGSTIHSYASNSGSGGCYVATAVYGSYDCPEVWTLRRFRDNDLAKTLHGRLFIKGYYAVSPTFVKWFGGTPWFQKYCKNRLDKLVSVLQKKGYDSTPYTDRK